MNPVRNRNFSQRIAEKKCIGSNLRKRLRKIYLLKIALIKGVRSNYFQSVSQCYVR